MHKRRSAIMSLTSAGIALITLTLGLFSVAAHADTTDVEPSANFSYETGYTTNVDIALAATGGSPALISLYSKGHNGLRLLQNGFTDQQGRYSSELQLPAHLEDVVLVIRSGERQDTLDLAIRNQTVAYAD
jgi:hypothetical protein